MPQDNTDETRISAKLARDGSATVEVKASARGSWTAELRRAFEPPGERRARAEEHLARAAFPNIKVTSIDVTDPHDIEKPFVTQIVASATAFASPAGAGLRFSPFGQRQSFVESYAQLSRRALPERLPSPQKTVIDSQVQLPQGWTATLPEGAHESGPQGSYQVSYARDGGSVVARLELTLNGGLLLPAEYGAFRGFLGRLDEALHRRVEAGPAPQTASAKDLLP
jgi:hypothetical protein